METVEHVTTQQQRGGAIWLLLLEASRTQLRQLVVAVIVAGACLGNEKPTEALNFYLWFPGRADSFLHFLNIPVNMRLSVVGREGCFAGV